MQAENFRPIKKKKRRMKTIDIVFILTMLIVPVLHFIIFWFVVNIDSIIMAFQIPTGEWSLHSFKLVFASLEEGFKGNNSTMNLGVSIKNTLLFFVKDVLMMGFHLLIAYFLYKKVTGYKQIRIMLYLPSIISGVAITTMFQNFIMPMGPLGVILAKLGVDPVPEFLANTDYATWTIMFYTIWIGWGGNMLLLGGALARIPLEVIESARLEGVTPGRELIQIVLPMIWPTLSTLLILQMTGLFNAGGPVLLFTQGAYGTSTLGYWIFAKVKFDGVSAYNQVSAAGLLFTAIGVPVILFVRWLIERIPAIEY